MTCNTTVNGNELHFTGRTYLVLLHFAPNIEFC